jgi:hypothetical protein
MEQGEHLLGLREAEIRTVPICVTGTDLPLGSLTNLETVAVIVLK